MPGSDRGIGRYLHAVRSANDLLHNDVTEISRPLGSARLSEFAALPHRSRCIRRARADIFHAPIPYLASPSRRLATAVSILDIIPLDVRSHVKTGVKAEFFYRLASRADAILTLSRHSAGRIETRLGVPRERIVIAPLPPAPAFGPVGATEQLLQPYVAAMADFRSADPRKRLHWVQRLSLELIQTGTRLVVVGAGTERLTDENLTGLGRITDDAWAAVLRGASFLAYTSAYEGQGMPLIEAIACGTPVVAMNNSALPEVVGHAGMVVDEGDDDSSSLREFLDACLRLARDQDALSTLRAHCPPQAEQFTPARFASALSLAYSTALEARP